MTLTPFVMQKKCTMKINLLFIDDFVCGGSI